MYSCSYIHGYEQNRGLLCFMMEKGKDMGLKVSVLYQSSYKLCECSDGDTETGVRAVVTSVVWHIFNLTLALENFHRKSLITHINYQIFTVMYQGDDKNL